MNQLRSLLLVAAITLGLIAPAAAQAAATDYYGTVYRASGLGNLEVGSSKDRRVDYRFKAEKTGDVESVRVYFINDIPKGYAGGDGGDINVFLRTDDGNGNPDSSQPAFASHVVTDPLTSEFTTVTFDTPAHLVEGQVYHLGFYNKDASPATNFTSIDDLWQDTPQTPVQKTIADDDLAVLYRDSSSAPWTLNRQHTPIFTLKYTDGSTAGPGAPYVNARSDSALYDVGGTNRVAELFTVSGGDKVVTGADFRLRRVSDTGDLTFRLASATNTSNELARVVVPASSISTSDEYVHVDFPSAVTLADGQSYRLMVFAFDGDYKTYPLTEGDAGFDSPRKFTDGYLQSSSNNGGAWITPDLDDDAQAFFTLQGEQTPPPPAEPVAAFDATQDYGTRYDLDASASTGSNLTYAWEVDGQPLSATTATVDDAGPLQTMGQHHAKLTVTDDQGHTDVAEKDFDVVYRMWPYYAEAGPGDNDPWQTDGVVEDFPEWTDWVRVNGPWRSITAVNRTDQGSYAFQPQSSDPSVLRLEVHQGDHPTSGGADRAGISLCPNCFNWTGAGYSGDPDIQAQVGAANGTNTPRFYRLGFKMDESTTLPLIDEYDTINADGTTTHHKADIHNMVEWHGFAPGGSQLKIGPTDSTGNVWGVQFAPTDLANPGSSLPTRKIDVHQIVPGEWQDYVVEVLWRRDDSGYIKVWRNGECVSCGHPQDVADGVEDGKIHGVTLRLLKDGSWDSGMGFNVQHYRAVDFRDPTVAWYRHPAIGMSYDDVMAQG